VNIEDPLDPDMAILGLRLGPCAVATSSVTKRTWDQAGRVRHHLIDPRTGEPVAGDALSVTVVTDSLVTAEVYAKAILISGENRYSGWAPQRADLSYYVVGLAGRITTGPTEPERLPSPDPIHFEYAASHV
jgi:thiamine biosynthesis lipoprotein